MAESETAVLVSLKKVMLWVINSNLKAVSGQWYSCPTGVVCDFHCSCGNCPLRLLLKKNWSSKDHTWSVVPNALLGIIQWRSGVKQQGIGPEGLMSCRTQGRISKCPEGAYFRLYMTNLGHWRHVWRLEGRIKAWRADLRLGGKFEVWRADLMLGH